VDLLHVLADFEPNIQELLAAYWQQFQKSHPNYIASLSKEVMIKLSTFWASSEFIFNASLQDPTLINIYTKQNPKLGLKQLILELENNLLDVTSLEQINQQICRFKLEKSAIIAWQQIINKKDLKIILAWTSQLADAILKVALDKCYIQLSQRYGYPVLEHQVKMPLYVVALGKLGGNELNFSSDLDIIFVYVKNGIIKNNKKELTHQEFFTKLVQLILQMLHPNNPHNRVYRIDLRLRPYGKSGPLVSSYSALEKYYQEQGRDWERYALVKARIINQDKNAKEIAALLNAFVYRKYLDYSAFNALRDMKSMIKEQSKESSLHADIKRGEGGIREIEFIAQAFQIIKGGRLPALKTSSLLMALKACQQENILSKASIAKLKSAYLFLRELENCLQILNDKQIHHLPDDNLEQKRVTVSMSVKNWQLICSQLKSHQKDVAQIFKETITPTSKKETTIDLLVADLTEKQIKDYFNSLGLNEVNELYETLMSLKSYIYTREATPIARKRMALLLPNILTRLAKEKSPNRIFKKLLPLLTAISLRSAYLVLLLENPNTLVWLIQLAKRGGWFIERIAQFPILLDELLDLQIANEQLTETALQKQLRQRAASIATDDIEQQMLVLREFKLKTELLIAIQQINQMLSAEAISQLLTILAEAIIQQVFSWTWQQVTQKYGKIVDANCEEQSHCIIVSYGNLGAYSMNYQSDLDLILVFDVPQEKMTDGHKSISAMEFYAKLFQRMLTMLGTQTTSGVLYETDTRLRPSGNQGLVVVTLAGFKTYQLEKAWTYEHQALIRARPVAGDYKIYSKFQSLRSNVLSIDLDSNKIKHDILNMAQRLRADARQLSHESKFKINTKSFKNCAGSITDIDFMVQYTVLIYAKKYPLLLKSTKTTDIVRTLGEYQLWSVTMAEQVVDIYEFYQECLQQVALIGILSEAISKKIAVCQRQIIEYWQQLFEEN